MINQLKYINRSSVYKFAPDLTVLMEIQDDLGNQDSAAVRNKRHDVFYMLHHIYLLFHQDNYLYKIVPQVQ